MPNITAAWKELNNLFKTSGSAPRACVLGNETSKDFLYDFEEEKIAHQLANPHEYRSDRAIRTCKTHFNYFLAGTDPNFTISEWDRLIPQANAALKIL